jgi:Na+/H+ antiporter NhaD/arsenite permease-like protein
MHLAPMLTLLIAVFIIGYAGIALEHPLRIDKAATSLLTGGLCWTIYVFQAGDFHHVNEELLHHLGEIASIAFFLLGAMTIVEIIDGHDGFEIITRRLNSTSKSKLLISVAIITFFLSSILDNLTTAIVMTMLTARLLSDKTDRLYFASLIIIAANAGGAWSPLGDVSTTMLWIGGQITAVHIIMWLILPSIAVCFVPVMIQAIRYKGQTITPIVSENEIQAPMQPISRYVLLMGVSLLIFVPVFKTATHLPPFMGMLIALAIMWIFTTLLHAKTPVHEIRQISVAGALRRIDTPSILFFLGILLAVSALDSAGILKSLADFFDATLGNDYLIGITLGVLSAIVDNVPLVAAAQGMYDLETYPTDHVFWTFLTLTTGTGGSMIIIGSAAGVAVMGIEKVEFFWYLKRIAWLAAVGLAAGIAVFMAQMALFG